MKINANYEERVSGHPSQMSWTPSPAPGVDRIMLDRIGDEVARATSIVRYAAESSFAPHTHDGGEEFFVLEGVFQDEYGDYPAGTYVRNPPGTRHAPGSAQGCTIFVKLRQFAPGDQEAVVVNTKLLDPATGDRHRDVSNSILFTNDHETVRIEDWKPGVHFITKPDGGLEILCLEGSFTEGGELFDIQSWLRLPVDAPLNAAAGPDGCRVWIKEGHLRTLREDNQVSL